MVFDWVGFWVLWMELAPGRGADPHVQDFGKKEEGGAPLGDGRGKSLGGFRGKETGVELPQLGGV